MSVSASDRPKAPVRSIVLAFFSAAVGLAIGAVFLGQQQQADSPQAAARPGGGPPAGGFAGGFGRGAPPSVTFERVTSRQLNQTLTAIGTGRALQSLTLTAEVAGVVREIRAESGQKVSAGEVLVVLDRREEEIAVERARADFSIAQTNAARFRELAAQEAASALEYEAAQNELSAVNAQLRQAEFNLSQRTIRAPFDGVIGLIRLDIGDYLSVGAPVTTIDDVSSLLVDFVIPEGAAGYVRPGLQIRTVARATPGVNFEGRVRAIDSRIDPASRTRRIEAIIANDQDLLIPGATFSITLDVPGREAAAIPGLALQWDRAGSFVWRVNATTGAAERVPVVIVERRADEVLVDGGLQARDVIVFEGADMVRAGMTLMQKGGDDSPTAFQ